MRVAILGAGCLIGMLGGCATLTRGTVDHVAIQSTPDGAVATSSLGGSCTTPCALTVARDAAVSVTVAKPGFASRTVRLETRVAGDGAADAAENIVTAGLGLGVDAITGATLEHVPNAVVVTLAPLAPPRAPKPYRRAGAS